MARAPLGSTEPVSAWPHNTFDSGMRRPILIVSLVVLLHALVLSALQRPAAGVWPVRLWFWVSVSVSVSVSVGAPEFQPAAKQF